MKPDKPTSADGGIIYGESKNQQGANIIIELPIAL